MIMCLLWFDVIVYSVYFCCVEKMKMEEQRNSSKANQKNSVKCVERDLVSLYVGISRNKARFEVAGKVKNARRFFIDFVRTKYKQSVVSRPYVRT